MKKTLVILGSALIVLIGAALSIDSPTQPAQVIPVVEQAVSQTSSQPQVSANVESPKVIAPSTSITPSPTISPVKSSSPKPSPTKEVASEQKPKAESQPTPKSEPSCNPNYSGCLKINAGDYDCKSGSGNGPNYTGKVQVLGNDEFDLDRDNDGWGCE